MKAGIDLGSTLIKIAYQKKNKIHFLSSANYSISELAKNLKQNKITYANLVGIGELPKQFNFLKTKQNKNKINHEIKTQIKGLQALQSLPNKYILVSIGTGISYTKVKCEGENCNSRLHIYKYPIGSSIGGGTILGLSKKLGFKDFDDLVKHANKGDYSKTDIFFQDYIVSNLAKVSQKTSKTNLAAGLMNLLAITVYKDLTLYKLNQQNIFIIGSTLTNNFYLRKLLKKYLKNIFFIKNSEYASCLGALLS